MGFRVRELTTGETCSPDCDRRLGEGFVVDNPQRECLDALLRGGQSTHLFLQSGHRVRRHLRFFSSHQTREEWAFCTRKSSARDLYWALNREGSGLEWLQNGAR